MPQLQARNTASLQHKNLTIIRQISGIISNTKLHTKKKQQHVYT